MTHCWTAVAAGLIGCAGLAWNAQAQTAVPARDPTLPPPSMALAADDASAEGSGLPLRAGGANVLVRAGKAYLVVGSRLVAPGQMVDNYQLERITETEIWLRDASGITKVARFSGVQRQATPVQCRTPAASAPRKSATKSPSSARKMAPPTTPKTGARAPRPTRENDPHDC